MSVGSVLNVGLSGILSGTQQMNAHAGKIARYGQEGGATSESQLIESAVGLKQSELQVKASAMVVNVAAKVSDSLIDIYA